MSAATKLKAARPYAAAAEPAAQVEIKNFVDNHLADAFNTLADLLEAARMTDEPHDGSGDSDRLLCVASGLARAAAANPSPQGEGRRESVESIAFDIAALIKGARLVPGDTESSPRTTYLERAGAIIALLAECDLSEAIDPGAPRPQSPNARARVFAKAPAMLGILQTITTLIDKGVPVAMILDENSPTLDAIRDVLATNSSAKAAHA